MMTEASMFAESMVAAIVVRLICLATVLLALAWLLARAAGPHRAAFRSQIWTTALVLVLLLPVFSVLCETERWAAVDLPAGWLLASRDVEHEHVRIEAAGLDEAAGNPALAFVAPQGSGSQRLASLERPVAASLERPTGATGVAQPVQPTKDRGFNARTVIHLLFAVWGLGVALGLIRLANGIRRVNSLFDSVRPLDPARLARIAPQVCRAVGIGRLPEIAVSESAPTALAVLRRFRGTVVLPAEMLDELSDSELTDVVIHECAHVRNRDPIIGWLQSIAAILYWPHPLIHLANRRLARAREEVCDNFVLQGSDAVGYAKTLLAIAERGVTGSPLAGALPLSGNVWRLEERIKGLLQERRSTRVAVGRWTGAAIIVLLCTVAAVAGAVRFGAAQEEDREAAVEEDVAHEAWHPQNVTVLGDERGRKWSLAGRGLDVHPNGEQVAAGGFNGVIFLWNAKTMRLEHLLSGHEGSVQAVHYSGDGTRLVSVGADKAILSWDLTVEGNPTCKSIGSTDKYPGQATWSADRDTAVFAQKIWRYSNRRVLTRIAGELPPHEAQKAVVGQRAVYSTETKAWIESFQAKSVLTFITQAKALSADGSQVAVTSGGRTICINGLTEYATRYTDSTVTVSRIADDELRKRFDLERVGHVQAMAFSPDGDTLAVGCQGMKTRLFDIRGDRPQLVQTLDHDHPVNGLCFDPLGHKLAVTAGNVQVWDMTRNPPVAGKKAPLDYIDPLGQTETAISPNGRVLYFRDGAVVRRWDLSGPFQPLEGETLRPISETRTLRFTGKNQFLCVAGRGKDSEIVSRDLSSLTAEPKPLVRVKDRRIGKVTLSLDGRRFGKVTPSPDGRRFVFSAYRGPRYTLQLWERTPDGARQLDTADLEIGYPGSFWCTTFSPDGTTLASGHRDGKLRLWDLREGKLELRKTGLQVNSGGIGGMDYSPDGKTLATVDWGGGVKLWDMSGEEILSTAYLGRHEERAYTVRFSPDGRTLASGDYGGDLKLWHLDEDAPSSTTLTAHTANVRSLVFGPDGKKLLSAGGDGRVIVWDVEQASVLQEWEFPGLIYDAQLDPTGRKIVSANGNGSIYVWDL